MSGPAGAVLALLVAVAGGAAGFLVLSSVLVMGGRTGQWLERRPWVCAAILPVGGVLLAVGVAVPVWPLAPLGGALALTGVARYLWLNV